MADHLKDNEDLALEALFASAPIADDGFSTRVVRRIRRRTWARRITMPIAVFLGSLIAAGPLAELMGNLPTLLDALPVNASSLPVDALPSTYMLVGGGMLLALVLFALNILED
jgi:hypothetical protein